MTDILLLIVIVLQLVMLWATYRMGWFDNVTVMPFGPPQGPPPGPPTGPD